MAELTIGSRIRKSPYYDATIAAGATAFTVYNHMFMPTSYGDPEREYRLLTEGVAIWDVAAQRQVEISGPDASDLTNYLCARDLSGCPIGRARYAPMCDHDGRLINDPVVLRVDSDRYWLSIADSDILLWARAVAAERCADVVIREADASPLAVQGPLAMAVARDLVGEVVTSLAFFEHVGCEIDDVPVVVSRSGWSRQGGVELFLTDATSGDRLWELVAAAGSAHGIGPGTPNQSERIESGLLSFASDTDAETDPVEAGLARFVSLDPDHQFLGRAGLERRLASANRRRLANVVFRGEVPVSENPWPAARDGVPVGFVRTAVWSPQVSSFVGLALVQENRCPPGTRLDVDTGEHCLEAVVSAVPFGRRLFEPATVPPAAFP